MSQAHAQKFYEAAIKDPALIQKLTEGNKTAEDFLAKVVAEAKSRGFQVSQADAADFMKANLADVKPGGELSDQQLESVAGGKTGVKNPSGCLDGFGQSFTQGFLGVVGYSWGWGP